MTPLIAVLALCGIVGAVLVWGLRPIPEHPVGESLADDATQPMDPRSPLARKLVADLPDSFLQHRLFLMRTWDVDLPDMQVIAYETESGGIEYTSQQFFLPLAEDRDMMIAAFERSLLARVLASEDGSGRMERFRSAWHFMHVPARERTLMIETTTGPDGRFRHRTVLLGVNGTWEAFAARSSDSLLNLLTPVHLAYRNALSTWLSRHEPESARRMFRNVLSENSGYGGAHAWLAAIALRSDNDLDAARRHLAFAEELAPTLPGTRLLGAELRGRRNTPDLGEDAQTLIVGGYQLSAEGACLLAQAFMGLDQFGPARHLCEEILDRYPRNREARELIDQMDDHERRAET